MSSDENWFRKNWELLKGTAKGFGNADPLILASSIAFFTIFAMPGLLVILVEVAATLFQDENVKEALVEQAGGLMGEGLAGFLVEVFQEAGVDGAGIWDKVFGIGAVVISATMAFMALQRGLNRIWKVRKKEGQGFKDQLVTRAIALVMLAGFSFMLPISLMFDNWIVFLFQQVDGGLPTTLWLDIIGQFTSTVFLIVILTVLYKVLPNVKVQWGDVWQGAVLAGILFAAGRYVMGLYIKLTGIGEAFGAGQVVLVVLLWMFISAVIILFGAVHCHTVAESKGHDTRPGRNARQEDEMGLE
jgi:membrane protein